MHGLRKFPAHLWWLAALYCTASLLHFTHNAEYIAFYPNMPAWITRDTVYLAWLAITAVGAVALVFAFAGWRIAAASHSPCTAASGSTGWATTRSRCVRSTRLR